MAVVWTPGSIACRGSLGNPICRFHRVSINCGHCGHAMEMERSAPEARLSRELTIEAVPELFEPLRCGRCGQNKVRLFDDEGQILIDHADPAQGDSCGGPIPKPRFAALPDSRLCTFPRSRDVETRPAAAKPSASGGSPYT